MIEDEDYIKWSNSVTASTKVVISTPMKGYVDSWPTASHAITPWPQICMEPIVTNLPNNSATIVHRAKHRKCQGFPLPQNHFMSGTWNAMAFSCTDITDIRVRCFTL